MLKIKIFFSAILFAAILWVLPQQAGAVSNSIVMYQVSSGVGSASQEFLALYNNTDAEIDVTGWCVTNNKSVEFACLHASANVKIFVQARSYITIASANMPNPAAYDLVFPVTNNGSGSIIQSGDTLTVVDSAKQPVDAVSWASSLETGSALRRTFVSPGVIIDTDGAHDFIKTGELTILPKGTFEVETIIDVCPNIEGVQSTQPIGTIIDGNGNCVMPPPIDQCDNIDDLQVSVPQGYLPDGLGSCYVDVCTNIDGLQVIIPLGYDLALNNTCVVHDECLNLPDVQQTVPAGYIINGQDCVLDLLPLVITEVLPNATGTDAGKEYIELYNPTDREADLGLYALHVGLNNEKSYQFPAGSKLGPGEFKTFYDSEINFTLSNTTSRVGISGIDGTLIAQTDAYSNADDDYAWAYIHGAWQYTNQPTPGSANVAFLEDTEEPSATDAAAVACPEGKYRHPLTNRCRNIEADASTVVACEADQYRNPDTGRCRKLATLASLTPCKEGQYRSEETNRCRNAEAANAQLAACKEGQERNPDTNRCRNVTAAAVPNAAFAVEPVKDGAEAFVGWAALGGVGALALGYAAWEWRREIAEKIKGIGGIFTFRK